MNIARYRNQLALGVLILLIALGLVAQAPVKKPPKASAGAPPACPQVYAQVNVNCQSPGVYMRHTHTKDALQVNFHANASCNIVKMTGDTAVFGGKTQIQLQQGDNCEDIFAEGTVYFCVEGQTCPAPARSRASRDGLGSDPNDITVP